MGEISLSKQDKYNDGLVQDCTNSIANALELLQSCAKPLIYNPKYQVVKYIKPVLRWIFPSIINTFDIEFSTQEFPYTTVLIWYFIV